MKGITPSINISIIGHHKSGKSSLFGWLQGTQSELDLHKLKTQSKKHGFEDAHLAWVSHTMKEEQERGMSLKTSYLTIKRELNLQFFDTPGHEDFASDVISACLFSDVCVVVADGSVRKRSDVKVVGPSKALMYTAKACGVNFLVVVISKVDRKSNSQENVESLQEKLISCAKEVGFKQENVKVLRASFIKGEFSQDFFSLINSFNVQGKPPGDALKPVRLLIEDRAKLVHGKLLGYWLSGYLISGILKTGAKISIPKANLTAKIKEIQKSGEKVEKAACGDFVDITLTQIEGEFEEISAGFVLCSENFDQYLTQQVRVRGITNDPFVPILKKQEILLHVGNFHVVGKVSRILRKVQGKEIKERPRNLRGKTMGDIELELERPVPVECFKNLVKLARCVLTRQSSIVFAGMITDLL